MTETEKNTVIKYVKDLLFNNLNTSFSNAEIRAKIQEELGYSIAPATLGTIVVNRIGKYVSDPYIFVKNTWGYKIAIRKIYNLIKEKGQVFLCDKKGYRELIWDYNISNFNNEKVNSEDESLVEIGNNTYKKYIIVDKISLLPEWVFSYPNILKDIFSFINYTINLLPKKINKSDIELTDFFYPYDEICIDDAIWVDILIFIHKFTDNNNSLIFKGLNKNSFDLLLKYENDWEYLGIKEAINLLNLTKKLAICSVKNFEYLDDYSDIFCSLVEMEKLGWLSYLDTNRTYAQNYEIFEEYKDKTKNDIMSKNLKKLNFLNNYQITEDYIICVPQDKNDLVVEGKAQNNCVGYYYNDSIIDGDNLIYFIRNKENPTKSFVTCRYDLFQKETVEHRTKNNKWYDNEDLIRTIDKLIKENI